MDNSMKTYIAEGKVSALRRMELSDCEKVIEWRNNDRVRLNYIYMEKLTLDQEVRYFHEKVETGEVLHLIICDKTDGYKPVGCQVFNDVSTFLEDPENRPVEVGYFLGEDSAVGKGIAREAMRLGIRYVFDTYGAKSAFSRIFTFNITSINSCESIGMIKKDLLRDVVRTDGTKEDMYVLEITPESLDEALAMEHCRRQYRAGLLQIPEEGQGAEERKKVAFVLPCYRSEKTLPSVVKEIDATMAQEDRFDWRIVMVCDGSPDATFETIQTLCKEDPGRRTGIEFARNFGQHAALMAGIGCAREKGADIVICLDDDGQTPADECGKLIKAIEDGADAAYASYEHKQHSAARNLGTAMNESMTRVMLGKPKDLRVTSYFAMRGFVADEVLRYRNSYPYLIGLVLRATKNIVNVPVQHRKREIGTSGYTFTKLLTLWMNGFTAFSIKPLRIATLCGSAFAFAGFLYGIYTVIKKLVNPAVPAGFSAMMSAIVFFGGMIMLVLGLAGEYIGRTYITVSSAPQYVIRQTTDDAQEGNSSL